jgi:hypothetical protein
LRGYITEPKAFRNAVFRHIIATMTALPNVHMTVDEYLAWAEDRPGRYELCDGVVTAMSQPAWSAGLPARNAGTRQRPGLRHRPRLRRARCFHPGYGLSP